MSQRNETQRKGYPFLRVKGWETQPQSQTQSEKKLCSLLFAVCLEEISVGEPSQKGSPYTEILSGPAPARAGAARSLGVAA